MCLCHNCSISIIDFSWLHVWHSVDLCCMLTGCYRFNQPHLISKEPSHGIMGEFNQVTYILSLKTDYVAIVINTHFLFILSSVHIDTVISCGGL